MDKNIIFTWMLSHPLLRYCIKRRGLNHRILWLVTRMAGRRRRKGFEGAKVVEGAGSQNCLKVLIQNNPVYWPCPLLILASI